MLNRIYSRCLKRAARLVDCVNVGRCSVSKISMSPGASVCMREISNHKGLLAKDICSGLKQSKESIGAQDACDAVCDMLGVK